MKLSIFNTPRQPKPPQEPPDRPKDLSGPSAPVTQPVPVMTLATSENEHRLQQRILNRLLLVAILLGILVFAANLPLLIQNAQWLALGLYSLMLLALVVSAASHRLAYRWRVTILLLALLGIGVSTLIADGLYGNGRMFLIVLPFIAAILTNRRVRTISLVLSIAALGLVGALVVTGVIPTPPAASAVDSSMDWLVATANFALLAIAGTVSVAILLAGLRESLQRQHDLTQELENERARLEARVQQRTHDLQRRLLQIRTAAEINRAISRMLDIDQLLPQVCELVRQRFDLYYVGIFLVENPPSRPQDFDSPLRTDDLRPQDMRRQQPFDPAYPSSAGVMPAQTYAVLKAGSGEAGHRMLAEGHKLAVGGDSMIGWAVANRQPRIAQNVGQEMVRFNNPHLPLTRSELALPIQIHESKVDSTPTGANLINEGERDARVLGAMSIQSTQEAAFDQDDILILQSIADGLASAIENARLFTATQASLDEIRTLHRQYLEQAWQLEKARRGEIAYSFESGIPALAEPPPEGPLEVPIRLRDQVIGSLTLEPGAAGDSDDRSWSVEEMALVEAVTNQAALALENARLLDDTRRKVSLERSAANITSKLWASADIETILRTALQELGLSLGARDGRIELWPSGLGHRLPEGSAADNHPVAGAHTLDGMPATPQEELSGDNPVEDRHASD